MLDYAAISEIGNRKLNEDYLRLAEKDGKYCFVVCDGLGGHGMGDIASQFVSNIFIEQFNNCDTYEGFFELNHSKHSKEVLFQCSYLSMLTIPNQNKQDCKVVYMVNLLLYFIIQKK